MYIMNFQKGSNESWLCIHAVYKEFCIFHVFYVFDSLLVFHVSTRCRITIQITESYAV